MNMSTPTFSNDPQQQQRFRPVNSRLTENIGSRPRMPLLPPVPPQCANPYNHQLSNPQWTNTDRNVYNPAPPPMLPSNPNELQQQQVLTSQLFQKHQLIPVFAS